MINWKNLEKFIAPGKVVTLVMLIDGEEIGAFSFNVDSLAFKEALEAASHLDPVKVAEKKSEPVTSAQKKFDKQADKALGKKSEPKPEPEPLDEEEDDEDPEEILGDNDIDKVFVPDNKPMTREQIMMQSEPSTKVEPQRGSVSSGPVKEPEKPAQQQMQLTDEW
jgi:hypothetical protein